MMAFWLWFAALAAVCAWISWVDMSTRRIPNLSIIALVLLGAFWVYGDLSGPLSDHLAGGIFGATLSFALRFTFRAKPHKGLGLGDVKLIAVIGFIVGWSLLPAVLVVASSAAIVAVGARSTRFFDLDSTAPGIPFGPFLGGSTLLAVAFNHVSDQIAWIAR